MKMKRKRSNIIEQGDGKTFIDGTLFTALQMIGNQNVLFNTDIVASNILCSTKTVHEKSQHDARFPNDNTLIFSEQI